MNLLSCYRCLLEKGGFMECRYKLMSYGLPEEFYIIDHNGNLKHDFVNIWIERQRVLEQQRLLMESFDVTESDPKDKATHDDPTICKMDVSSSGGAEVPLTTPSRLNDVTIATNADVLLGRGVANQCHPGNVRLTKLIKDHWEKYNAVDKVDKTVMTWTIVKLIQNEGGRFLERETISANSTTITNTNFGSWKVCDDEVARNRVATGFRSQSKSQRKRRRNTPST